MSQDSAYRYGDKELRRRPWSEYPLGTRAYSVHGGYWIHTERGWKWTGGNTFPTPGGDAYCVQVPLPDNLDTETT